MNNGLTIRKSVLVPGDLVFWSYESNSRFMDITHVGIYAGDGKVWTLHPSVGRWCTAIYMIPVSRCFMADRIFLDSETIWILSVGH